MLAKNYTLFFGVILFCVMEYKLRFIVLLYQDFSIDGEFCEIHIVFIDMGNCVYYD